MMRRTSRQVNSWLAVLPCLLWWLLAIEPVMAQVDLARQSFPDVDTRQWNELADSRSVVAQLPTVMQLVFQLPNVSNASWRRYVAASKKVDLDRAADTPAEYAGAVFELSGTTTGLSHITLNDQLQQDYSYERLFVVEGKLDDDRKVVVVAPIVPEVWRRDPALTEPFATRGILVTVRNDGVPVFVALRVRWYPDQLNDKLEVGEGQLWLARHGLDLGEGDMIINRSFEAFTMFERELFEQTARAVLHMESDPPLSRGQPPDLKQLLENPEQFAGDLVELTGRIRRITPVQIQSDSLRAMLDRGTYYHVDLYVPLGNQGFRLKDQSGEVLIYGSYGVTLLLFDLPETLRDFGAGRQSVDATSQWSIPAFFIKTWIHKTAATREVSADLRRPNPVFFGIGSQAVLLETDEQAVQRVSSLIAWFWVALLVLVGGLFLWVWRSSTSRRRNSGGRVIDLSHLD
ncbi:MAG: hypothetical protein ACR2NP_14070 [Pirellulaceae bacterium]